MKIKLSVDPYDQWFVRIVVSIGGKTSPVTFKVDNGCNSLVLSHDTLEKLGVSVDSSILKKLPSKIGRLASGEKHTFKELGTVSLFRADKQLTHICNAQAICHATRETRDLLGTEIFKQFTDVNFHLSGNKYMELLKH